MLHDWTQVHKCISVDLVSVGGLIDLVNQQER